MRNPVACVSCRSAKQKCIHNDSPPCDRCKAGGRAEQCEFPAPGTSSFHRRPKRPREDSGSTPPSSGGHAVSQPPPTYRRSEAPTAALSPAAPPQHGSPISTASLLDGVDPFDLLTDEVINSYLRCSYKWSFHHTPTLLERIRDRSLETWMVWAMLALAIRFVKEPPSLFKTQTEASNAFAAHARQILQCDLETPSISRVQALLMLTGHDWGAGNGRRAWIYLGMAIRLVEVMGLTQEVKLPNDRRPTPEEFIEAEVRRRTAWTCFLMDSLLSGGKGRKRSLKEHDMAIQLPCEREPFVFGEPVCTPCLNGPNVRTPPVSLEIGEMSIIGYTIRVANIWGKVARWACSEVMRSETPWSSSSAFQRLTHELDAWKNALPDRLQYNISSLHSHNAVDQGQAYCYMHCIYFMSLMFLHRAYLPVLGPQNSAEETPRSYEEHKDRWKSWQKSSRKELFRQSAMVLEMLDEMRIFGVYFLRGLVPWIGFTIYTAVGSMLYSSNFPCDDDDPRNIEKAENRIKQGCTFLIDMKTQWPMAATWYETIKRMQAYYRSVLGQEGPVSPEERQILRRAMVDYGALQPSPVQKPLDSTKVADKAVDRVNNSREQLSKAPAPNPTSSPPQDAPSGSPSVFSWNQQHLLPPLGADESFDLDFDFSSAAMQDVMMNVTQDFWNLFPGEARAGYQPYA
ncbi:fungal-specific transcription factor domain-containing protein [Massariosphaeria phaeospora]|uniref:Fungal-specific transcription factor domain-containing protein n=1 Tax=Massariosphaeria phaeospora TaxID=100035 RepID=A0A7C8IDF5_9PLEO|nr:fungal-specific transcription factor domain-containing protein [Massariosphaeria phaeospora]